MPDFARKLIRWQRRHGRHDLPWQGTRDPYRIWVSEVMLQQTQVDAAISYYVRFIERFPDVFALASATQGEVLKLWSGLGYYARARHLRLAARQIVSRHGGKFPRSPEEIGRLPGVGRSTAGAILALAFGAPAAILDGNVKRVLARRFGVEGEARQWALAERLLPRRGIRTYTQALMDLGATVCTRARPACERCPVAQSCVARREGRIDELPAPRARRQAQVRRANWLVLLHDGRVLLERRPAKGLWGGLWTFPEFSEHDPARRARALGCRRVRSRTLPVLEHGFTHFLLRARPWVCEVGGVRPRAGPKGRLWLDIADAIGGAVPAPVRKLLAALAPAR